MGERLTLMVLVGTATLGLAGGACAQGFFARGDATCSGALSAADVVAEVRALGGSSSCHNDDCDRDGSVTAADARCTATCLFGQCVIPAHAPQVSSVTADSAPSLVPLSAIHIVTSNLGAADHLKRVTIGGREAQVVSVDTDTRALQVIVPAGLPAGPADVVVFDGDLPGPPAAITIAAPVPIGQPDTFDGTLGLADTAAALLLALDLEGVYSAADAGALRAQLQRFRADLATQRAALGADSNYTADVRARFDAAFDSSGTPEQLRQLIADIETLFETSALGRSARRPAAAAVTVAVAVSRFASTVAVLAGEAGSTAPLLAAPAAPLLGIGLPAVLAIGAIAALAAGGAYLAGQNSNPPGFLSIIFEDGNGRSRLKPVAGGVVHIAGKNFLPSADIVVNTAYGEFTAQRLELTDETIAARLPTDSGLCGAVDISVVKSLGVRGQPFHTNIQPILNEVRPAPPNVVNPGEELDLVVRGVAPCEAIAAFKGPVSLDDDETAIQQLSLVTLLTMPLPVFPPDNYTARVKVEDVVSDEELPFQVGNPITGLTVSCTASELAVPPGAPATAMCSADVEPMGEVGPINSKFVWNSDSGSVAVTNSGSTDLSITRTTTITGRKIGSAKIHAALTFGTQTLGQSQKDVDIIVVDKTPPVISIASSVTGAVSPGASIDITVTVSDNVGLGTVSIKATGDAVTNPDQDTSECLTQKTCSPTFTVNLKDMDFTQHTVTVQAEATDGGLNHAQSNTLTFMIAKDTSCPDVFIQSPSDGGTVNAGSTVQVVATASDALPDDTGVKKFIYSASGDALTAGVSQTLPFPMPLPNPMLRFNFSVKQAADLVSVTDKTITVSVEAVDDAGNTCGPDLIFLTAIGTLDQCDGGISTDNPSDCDGKPFTITVVIAGAAADKVTRVTSINPGGQFDLQKSGNSYQVTLFYQGTGSFSLSFTAFDADGHSLCSGSIGLTATGPCPTASVSEGGAADRAAPAGAAVMAEAPRRDASQAP